MFLDEDYVTVELYNSLLLSWFVVVIWRSVAARNPGCRVVDMYHHTRWRSYLPAQVSDLTFRSGLWIRPKKASYFKKSEQKKSCWVCTKQCLSVSVMTNAVWRRKMIFLTKYISNRPFSDHVAYVLRLMMILVHAIYLIAENCFSCLVYLFSLLFAFATDTDDTVIQQGTNGTFVRKLEFLWFIIIRHFDLSTKSRETLTLNR